ncbi:MAG TPA: lysoplasmalogenase family protein, partial [Pirellulales bacterium]|nr:lysoplasmalogenase family protein [Pirellulales bacterium]
ALAIAVGMTLGAIGDFFNAGLLAFLPLEDPVLGGIVAFALGHVAYITGAVGLARRAGLTCAKALAAAILTWQFVGLVGWAMVALAGTEARALVWPALPYSLLLAGTAGVATGLALQDRRFVGLALGGALFLTSDLLLAFGLFRGPFDHQTACVWLTYGPAQMLIVYSVPTALRMLANHRAAVAG